MLRTVIVIFALVASARVFALPEFIDQLPEGTRIWENRSDQEGMDYRDFPGPDIAFLNQEKGAWYFRTDQDVWRKFAEGERLNFSETGGPVEALSYEVLSGTSFLGSGSARDQELILDGPSGELLTQSGHAFNPEDFELLKNDKGATAYLDLRSNTWWPVHPLFESPLSRPLSAPLHPVHLKPGLLPSPNQFSEAEKQAMRFEPSDLRYLNASGQVIAFHPLALNGYKEWKNASNMPCSNYSDYPGDDVWYVNGIWYHEVQDRRWIEFHRGRYLSFDDEYGHDFLAVELSNGRAVNDQGSLADQSLRLDGVTGQLVDAQGQALPPQSYNSQAHMPEDCATRYTLLLNESLHMHGLGEAPEFVAAETEVTLLNVVPQRYVQNNPFNDRTLVQAISLARGDLSPVISVPNPIPSPAPIPDPDPIPVDPPAGSCPLNQALSLTAVLPDGSPLGNVIGISFSNQLSAGFAVPPSDEALRVQVMSGFPNDRASVGESSQFSRISGDNLGTQLESTELTYRLRRNSDLAEFEITLRFDVDIVFDDLGVIFTALSGRQCTIGAPL